jgi:hypothetical protein
MPKFYKVFLSTTCNKVSALPLLFSLLTELSHNNSYHFSTLAITTQNEI